MSVSMAVWSALEPHLETAINLDLNDIDENRQFAGIVLDVVEAVAGVRAALEVSSRTVAPDVDALAQTIRAVDGSHSLGAGELAEAIVADADLWQPAPVIDRDALQKKVAQVIFYGWGYPAGAFEAAALDGNSEYHMAQEAAEALLASGWQPASPRTVTTGCPNGASVCSANDPGVECDCDA